MAGMFFYCYSLNIGAKTGSSTTNWFFIQYTKQNINIIDLVLPECRKWDRCEQWYRKQTKLYTWTKGWQSNANYRLNQTILALGNNLRTQEPTDSTKKPVMRTNLKCGTGNPWAGHTNDTGYENLFSITSYFDFDDTFGKVLVIGSVEIETNTKMIVPYCWDRICLCWA